LATPFNSLRGQLALGLIHPILSVYPDVFHVGNKPVLEADHSTPSIVQFKNGWSYSFTHTTFMVCTVDSFNFKILALSDV
jgi:hypothetical protein